MGLELDRDLEYFLVQYDAFLLALFRYHLNFFAGKSLSSV
jgi:hypothetical protein